MSDIATAIVSRIQSETSLFVYPEYVRENDNQYPLAVYQIKVTPCPTFSGDAGLRYATLTVAAIDTSYAGSATAAHAIETAINGQHGTWAGIVIQGVFLQDDGISDDVVTEPVSEMILAYVKTMTFDIAFEN